MNNDKSTTPAAVEALKLAREAFEARGQHSKRLLWKRGGSVFAEDVPESDYVDAGTQRDWLLWLDAWNVALAHQPPANTPSHTPPTGVSGAVQAKREPLTADEVIAEWSRPCYPGDIHIASAFEAGVRFAERNFGIGAAGEGAEQ